MNEKPQHIGKPIKLLNQIHSEREPKEEGEERFSQSNKSLVQPLVQSQMLRIA